MDYASAKVLWDRRIKRNDFRRIPHTSDTIEERSDGLFVYGYSARNGILFRPDGAVRIVGEHLGYIPTTSFYNRQLPCYASIEYCRGYAHGNYVLRHIDGSKAPFVDGLEFFREGIRNAGPLTSLVRAPDVKAPPELRAVGRKIKQAWRTQLLIRTRLGVYDILLDRRHPSSVGAVERGEWLEEGMARLCADQVRRFSWSSGERVEVSLYDRVKRGFELVWRRDMRDIYEDIRDGRLTLDFFL